MVTDNVAAAVSAAEEGGILPPGLGPEESNHVPGSDAVPPGETPRLYGRQDAHRYALNTANK